jgi:hypothetical protein
MNNPFRLAFLLKTFSPTNLMLLWSYLDNINLELNNIIRFSLWAPVRDLYINDHMIYS